MDSMLCIFKPAKLLVCFLGRNRGDRLMKVSKAAGARGGTIVLGRTLTDSPLLRLLALADVDQDVVFTILGPEADAVVSAVAAAAETDKKLAGTAILMDVSGMLFRVPGPERETDRESGDIMQSGYKLINVIVNHGHADDVMAAARAAGAKGGTILTARGTGTEEDVKFFGITLVPEKEMLMIVAEQQSVPAILEAVAQVSEICRPGGGIVFHMNVERFIPLGPKEK